MQTTPLFLISYYQSPVGGATRMITTMLTILLCFVIYSLWKKGKFKQLPVISGTILALFIGSVLILISFVASNFIPFQIGFAIITISSFLVIKKAKAKRNATTIRTYYPSYWAVISILYIIISTGLYILFVHILECGFDDLVTVLICVLCLPLSVLVVAIYFLPYSVANKKEHQQTRAIYILNIFAGWTIIAWIIALIWAHTIPSEHIHIHETATHSDAEKIMQFKELYDSGIISKEEFEAKKKQLLDL